MLPKCFGAIQMLWCYPNTLLQPKLSLVLSSDSIKCFTSIKFFDLNALMLFEQCTERLKVTLREDGGRLAAGL